MSPFLKVALAATVTFASAATAQTAGSSPEARRQMMAYGGCIADGSPAKATQTLQSDFRSPGYRAALGALNRVNGDCRRLLPRGSVMQASPLLMAGAMAERLMSKNSRPLNARLAAAARYPAPPTFSRSDVIAMCIVRSVPDDAARLFAAEVGTPAEIEAAKGLDTAVRLCSANVTPISINVEGLRAMLATAAFRNLAASAAGGKK